MCKYHKITKLSIAIVSLASLTTNFLFPHVAMANDIGKNNVLNFSFAAPTNILPLVLTKIANADDGKSLFILPAEPAKETNKIKKIVISSLAKKITEEENIDTLQEEKDKLAQKICQEAGITDLPCWQDLKAIREKESIDGKMMIGDGGRSKGWYQIQTKMHKISNECALDFECSTEWTVKNLIANYYETNRVYAISKHNGSGIMAQRYARSVVYNSAKFGQ